MVRYCSVYGCVETNYTNKNRKFYRFPSDEKRCMSWVRLIGRMDLAGKGVKTLHTSYFVCEVHFADSDRTTRVLKKNAAPTLLLPQMEESDSYSSKYTQTDISLLCCSCKSQISSPSQTPSTSQASQSLTAQPTNILTGLSPRKRKLHTNITYIMVTPDILQVEEPARCDPPEVTGPEELEKRLAENPAPGAPVEGRATLKGSAAIKQMREKNAKRHIRKRAHSTP